MRRSALFAASLTLTLALFAACAQPAAAPSPTHTPAGDASPVEPSPPPTDAATTSTPPTPTPEPAAQATAIPPTATPDGPAPELAETTPVIPEISANALAIYQAGLAAGRDPQVLTTVGDCLTTSGNFLDPLAAAEYELGEYSGLQAVIDQYGDSFARQSQAAVCGFNSASPSEPIWSDPAVCQSGESPLECELRISNAAVVLIMLGTHDLYYERPTFEGYMRSIVETTLEADALPILITFPPQLGYPEETRAYNATIIALADEYDIPVANLWRALNALPNNGIEPGDTVLLSLPSDGCATCFVGENLDYGETIHNLVVLQTLQALRDATEG